MVSNGFEDLQVWQKSRKLVVLIYQLTALLPKEEQFGLTAQIRRAAVSVSSNIAEGSARGSDKDFARFLLMAIGSAAEVKCQLILAKDLNYIVENDFNEAIETVHEIGKMIKGLRKGVLNKQRTL